MLTSAGIKQEVWVDEILPSSSRSFLACKENSSSRRLDFLIMLSFIITNITGISFIIFCMFIFFLLQFMNDNELSNRNVVFTVNGMSLFTVVYSS